MAKDHIIWIRESTWRVLSCYETPGEAKQALQCLRDAGDTVHYTVRDSYDDKAIRANVRPPGQEG